MSEIVVRRRHQMRVASAKRIADKMARRLQRQFGGSYTWQRDQLHFQRTGASGVVAVTAHEVEIRLTLGLVLRPLRSRIEREIHEFLDAELAKSSQHDHRAGQRSRSSRTTRPGPASSRADRD